MTHQSQGGSHVRRQETGPQPNDTKPPWPGLNVSALPSLLTDNRFRNNFGHLHRSTVSGEQYGNAGAGETGDPQENPPSSGIVRHVSHTRKSGGATPPGIEPGSSWWEKDCLSVCIIRCTLVTGACCAHRECTAVSKHQLTLQQFTTPALGRCQHYRSSADVATGRFTLVTGACCAYRECTAVSKHQLTLQQFTTPALGRCQHYRSSADVATGRFTLGTGACCAHRECTAVSKHQLTLQQFTTPALGRCQHYRSSADVATGRFTLVTGACCAYRECTAVSKHQLTLQQFTTPALGRCQHYRSSADVATGRFTLVTGACCAHRECTAVSKHQLTLQQFTTPALGRCQHYRARDSRRARYRGEPIGVKDIGEGGREREVWWTRRIRAGVLVCVGPPRTAVSEWRSGSTLRGSMVNDLPCGVLIRRILNWGWLYLGFDDRTRHAKSQCKTNYTTCLLGEPLKSVHFTVNSLYPQYLTEGVESATMFGVEVLRGGGGGVWERTMLATWLSLDPSQSFDVSSDEQRLLYTRADKQL
ncbi:hypothetical protein PR048_006624 [Dryococelus australis]|uniref:Uncharacterized protein n=1 Tax=Dryococelus australis TaxID=614101 RepID=A0ABQ9IBG3_9NEOP|nr:hypothetical protein PR048_006624 [Dryococelus australis]